MIGYNFDMINSILLHLVLEYSAIENAGPLSDTIAPVVNQRLKMRAVAFLC